MALSSSALLSQITFASLVQRANDLANACRRDRAELIKAGLKWSDVDDLMVLLKKCSDFDAEWGVQREKGVAATRELDAFVEKCRKLRGLTIKTMHQALMRAGLDIRLPSYRKSRSRVALVQDLNDVAVLCRMYQQKLEAVGFDGKSSYRAACASKELSDALADAELAKSTPLKALNDRNAACRELYESALRICLIGREAFSNDPHRKNDYRTIK